MAKRVHSNPKPPESPHLGRDLPPLSGGPTESPEFALSLRQPWAELVLSGAKSEEVRTYPTRRRGRVWIYAALTLDSEHVDRDDLGKLGFRRAEELGALPRGFLVGTRRSG